MFFGVSEQTEQVIMDWWPEDVCRKRSVNEPVPACPGIAEKWQGGLSIS